MIKVAVNGALGKVGRVCVETVKKQADMTLVKELDMQNDLAKELAKHPVDVVIEFTRPEVRMDNLEKIIQSGANAVVGTTGFTPDDLVLVQKWCASKNVSALIIPNFAIGSVLMMQFAKEAAKYFSSAEIIEYHHDQKVDYPSGTAIKTAQMMAEVRERFNGNTKDTVANLEGARGGDYQGIKIHSVRMNGMVAHQEVIFGEQGQYLTLRHDAVSRESYMPGVLLAVREAVKRKGLIYGLEKLL